MDSYSLNEQEKEAFDKIAAILKAIRSESQHKVLRKLAHDMGREIVRPGAVRVAAARAAAGSNRAGNTRSTVSSTNPKGRKVDPEYERAKKKFFLTEEGKTLVAVRDALKEGLVPGSEPPPEVKKKVSETSLAIRQGIDRFRNPKASAIPLPSQSGGNEDAKSQEAAQDTRT